LKNTFLDPIAPLSQACSHAIRKNGEAYTNKKIKTNSDLEKKKKEKKSVLFKGDIKFIHHPKIKQWYNELAS